MWVVVKYKTNELNYLMENLIKSYGQTVKFLIFTKPFDFRALRQ